MVRLALWKKKVPLRITAARSVTSKQAAKKTAPCHRGKTLIGAAATDHCHAAEAQPTEKKDDNTTDSL